MLLTSGNKCVHWEWTDRRAYKIVILTSGGSLWVPPAPGSKPSITSGALRTVEALSTATL